MVVPVLVAGLVVVAAGGPRRPSRWRAWRGGGPGVARDRCALDDPRLDEARGWPQSPRDSPSVNDSGNATVVYTLAPDCSVTATRSVGVSGRDVEDLARGADGTLWLADIGDNDRRRADHRPDPAPGPRRGRRARLVYPDGPHDAETLLLPADGRPVIVTKDLGGRSGVYTTDAPPAGPSPTPLRRVGEVVVPLDEHRRAATARAVRAGLYTGGALSADGRVAALRTYTDAWLFPVAGRHRGRRRRRAARHRRSRVAAAGRAAG